MSLVSATDFALVRACPVCTSTFAEFLHHQDFVVPDRHPLRDGYQVVTCVDCGFAFANTAGEQKDYDQFYMQHSKYEDARTSTGGGDTNADRERLKEASLRIANKVDDRNARILDVGCANGGLLAELQKLGFNELSGLDPSARCVRNTAHLGVAAYAGSLFDPPDEIGTYDVLILSHVMEHIKDLPGAMSQIRKLLTPGGLVYIEVPDALNYGTYLSSPFQEFNTEHINHFSDRCLRNLIIRNGFAVVGTGTGVLGSPSGTPYPITYCFGSRTDKAPDLCACRPESILRDRLTDYIARSAVIMERLDTQIRSALSAEETVIVWGTGQLAMKLLVYTALKDTKIVAFVDSNPINCGKTIQGVPVLAPESIRGFYNPILVATILHSGEIERQIRLEMRLPNRVVCLS